MAQEAQEKPKVVTVEQLTDVAEAQKTYIDAMDKKLSDNHNTLKTAFDNLKKDNDEYDIPERAETKDIQPIIDKFNVPEDSSSQMPAE